jgi:hypothetical protein
MKIWLPGVISNERLWEMTGQININKEIRKSKFGWIGQTLCKALQGSFAMEPTRYKRKGYAEKFMATNYTERMWETQLE